MASSQKDVKIKVETEAKLTEVQALENKINEIKRQKLALDIQTNTVKLEDTKTRINEIKAELKELRGSAEVDDSKVKALETELSNLEGKKLDLEVAIEKGKLDSVEAEIEELDGSTIDVDVNNISAMEAVDQIGQGFDRLKQGASEVGAAMGEILESAGKQETNYTFLEQAVGDPKVAQQKMNEIKDIVTQLPGDDTAVQGLLSQAIAKDASVTTQTLKDIGVAYADYASAMSFYGKSGVEAQQDMTNYILAGNTAELERSPILSSHIDKLKEATTVQERAQLLQQALNEEHWGGMSQQDTFNNKLETFNGMLERGKYNLGGMFQEGAKWGMDFLMNLDDASGGIVGMGIALGGFASPLTDSIMGLGQMATGLKALKDLEMIKWLKDLEIMTKLSAAADWLLSGAQAVLNAVMSMNPIVLVVLALIALAAALVWAYYNVDWFREMVDNAWKSLVQFGQYIYGVVTGALQWLGNLFSQFTQQIGLNTNDWRQAVLGFILFIPQLPLKLGIALVNALAKVLGFGDNFVQSLTNAASNAVNGFISYITQLPGIVMGEFNRVLGMVNDFINSLPDRVWDMGAAIIDALKASLGIGSPGYMYYMVEGEYERIENLTKKTRFDTGAIGASMVSSFNPNLSTSNTQINGTGGDIIVNVYGDIDNDRRIRELVDAVRRELNWNNTTAGRTV